MHNHSRHEPTHSTGMTPTGIDLLPLCVGSFFGGHPMLKPAEQRRYEEIRRRKERKAWQPSGDQTR
jgi:hypothetical protein